MDHRTFSRVQPLGLFSAIVFAVVVVVPAFSCPVLSAEAYRLPPENIVHMVDAPPLPYVSVDPSQRNLLLMERASLPPLSDMVQPMWRLAGYRVNPATNGRHAPRSILGLRLRSLADGSETPVGIPENSNVGYPSWSPDGSRIAFTLTTDTGIELWGAEASSGKARRLVSSRLNGAMGSGFQWMPDGNTLLCRFVPDDRGKEPLPARVPSGPNTRETSGRVAPVRTYQDLLKNPFDEARFDWVMTTHLGYVDFENGSRKLIGKPAIYGTVDPSPDGSFLLLSRIVGPYSYLVTARSFPEIVTIHDLSGKVVREIASLPLRDEVAIGGVPVGRRRFSWQPNAKATLTWVEALDDGNPKNKVSHRDGLWRLLDPTSKSPEFVLATEHRYSGTSWLGDGSRALVAEYDRDRRWTRTWLADLRVNSPEPRLVWDRSSQDRYGDPGQPITTRNKAGRRILLVQNGSIFLKGRGASAEGDRPFLDRMVLETLMTKRLWRCAGENYESVVDLLSTGSGSVLTRYETPDEPANYYVRNLEDGSRRRLTDFVDPAPEFASVKKELVTYDRGDGVKLSATLYVPGDHQKGRRLPLLVWAYPREFNSAKTASQVSGSPYRFTRPRGSSHLFFLTQGYAIMDGASMPVVGSPEKANDTFVSQIVSSAQAAIEKAVDMGVADGNRVGVGGHSYGAFMTANLLAHCDLFRAGVARSGAYNRTLTPFGFQNERRTFWEAPQIYFSLSPFMHADKINEPVLLVHGEIDNNSGTFPIQSERLYHAIKGHGGHARLVMLPFESHGYRSRESILHVLAESVDWFDRHVKNAAVSPQ